MNIREIDSIRLRQHVTRATNVKSRRPWKFISLILIGLIVLGWIFIGHSHATGSGVTIKSGYSGQCLDNHRDNNSAGNTVDLWGCNGQSAQQWTLSLTQISKPNHLCLNAESLTVVDLASCDQSSSQVWLADKGELYNPHYGLCLTAPSPSQSNLDLQSCNQVKSGSQKFTPSVSPANQACRGDQGSIVACWTVKEWIKWQASLNNQENYLTNYTGGSPYEEWCADFVSYVYKEAGFAFQNGDPGWDENVADQIVDQGFTVHQAGSYLPKAGDVAYFDYNGGHVEIVVVGGKTPTFIYGDSATIDPNINNGAMEANDITQEKDQGNLIYYLSPNSST